MNSELINNPYIKRDFGSNSALFGDNQVLAFEFEKDTTKVISNISASFRLKGLESANRFHQSAVAVVRGKVESKNGLPVKISDFDNERIELLQFFNTYDGLNLTCYITAGITEVLSVILFPAFLEADLVNPSTEYGTLNVYGAYGNAKPRFTVSD